MSMSNTIYTVTHERSPSDLLDNFQLTTTVPGKRILPIIPDAHQFGDVPLVNLIDIRRVRCLRLHDGDRFADDNVDRSAVGHKADVVVEDAYIITQSVPFTRMMWMSGGE